ncbi:MAG: hypothetical protein NC548_43765 [Lachnospiraceae bacterium]|nr:hypothetical protein [Corallococcus sp.]MCM1221419.1 hypothetical protein [Lachnospiraceae bacterium]
MKLKKGNNRYRSSKRKYRFRFGRRVDLSKIYLAICVLITAAIVTYVCCRCFNSVIRSASSVIDFATSIVYYFANFFVILSGKNNPITATVVQVPFTSDNVFLPQQYEQFVVKLQGFWSAFISEDNFVGFFADIPQFLYNLSIFLMFALPVLLIAYVLFRMSLSGQNNDTDVPTKHMLRWLWIEDNVIRPIKRFVDGFVSYVRYYSKWRTAWLLLVLLGLNAYTYILEVLAFLLYFVSSFDFVNIYTQAYKLFVDIDITFSCLPTVVWVVIIYWLITVIRRRIGLNNLRHMESKNCGYVRTFGICTMITATMGKGKTLLMTDFALTISSEFKYSSKNIMFEVERWFPFFPWATLQNGMKEAFAVHKLYSFTTAEAYARSIREDFEAEPSRENICNYDFERYGLYYNDELQMLYLFDVLEEYCKAFFVYYVSDSLITGNYSIREDGIMQDIGNMPMWDYDYFTRSPLFEEDMSYYAHILDFDVLRKGKRMVKDSKFADTFEGGIVTITELDKERGNTLDTKELKKNTDEANQKNDLFNYSPKMGRHPATIMYQAFIRFLVDQQRAMKTDADFRQICDNVINIEDVTKDRLALPLFFVEELIYSMLKPSWDKIYENYRFNRADNSLLMYSMKNTVVRFINWYERQYNLYGYDLYALATDSGKLDGDNVRKDRYYLSHKKAKAHRYATDCYKEFFRQKSAKKDVGIVDYPTFGSVTATADELKSMNSYFINDMVNKICAEDDE